MDNNLLIALAVVALVIVLLFVLRGRKTTEIPPEGHGVADGAAHAVEDIAGPLLGVDVHPDHWLPNAPEDQEPDNLTTLKGLGPKAAAQLNSLGITHFAQLAALDNSGVSSLDNLMGSFQGRLIRDQWVEQAKLLAVGDRAGFEDKYGKLGGGA